MHESNLSGIDLNLLKLFDALLKERHVTRAGQRLGLSQPAASRGLGRLRHLFNDQLVIRASHGLELTPRAMELSEPVARLLEDARSIVSPAVFEPGDATGRFTLATADHMAAVLLPGLLTKLDQLAPGVDLDIPQSLGDNVDLIIRGDADFAVGLYHQLPARLYQRTLYEEDLVCLMRCHHPVVTRSLTLEHFIALKHISVIITGQGKSALDEALASQGMSRRVAVRLPHFLAAAALVARSDMILSLPRRLACQIAETVAVDIHELPLALKPFTPSIIWHGRRHNDPAHQWLRQLIVETAAEIV